MNLIGGCHCKLKTEMRAKQSCAAEEVAVAVTNGAMTMGGGEREEDELNGARTESVSQ